MCPAAISTDPMCIFHRNAYAIDAGEFVLWSQDASPEEYTHRAKDFIYGKGDNPYVTELRKRLKNMSNLQSSALKPWAIAKRQPGDDESEQVPQ